MAGRDRVCLIFDQKFAFRDAVLQQTAGSRVFGLSFSRLLSAPCLSTQVAMRSGKCSKASVAWFSPVNSSLSSDPRAPGKHRYSTFSVRFQLPYPEPFAFRSMKLLHDLAFVSNALARAFSRFLVSTFLGQIVRAAIAQESCFALCESALLTNCCVGFVEHFAGFCDLFERTACIASVFFLRCWL